MIAGLEWYTKVASRVGHCVLDEKEISAYLKIFKELIEENSNLDDTIACLKIELETERSDTLNAFQTRLTQAIGSYTNKDYVYVYAWFKLIDQIINDMIGETK
jgi:hypothetical protein